jgi:hypothetical protein
VGKVLMTLTVIAIAVCCWAWFGPMASVTYGLGVVAGTLAFDVWTGEPR